MKKIYFFVLCMFVLLSCEQNELDFAIENQSNDSSIGTTRATTSIADFDPISELEGIPVNIKNVGNTFCNLLSCAKKGTKVDLFNKDDGSLRQRWYISLGNIFLVGGNSTIPSPFSTIVGPEVQSCSYPILLGASQPFVPQHAFSLSSNKYYYHIKTNPFSLTAKSPKYLQANSVTGSDLSYKETNPGSLALWEILPIGEFELVDIQYVHTTVDHFAPTEMICDNDKYTNNHLTPDTWHYSLSTSYTEESDFSKTEGLNITISRGLNVGLPNLLGGDSSVGINTSIQQQTSKSWTYGTKDSKTITKTRTGDINVEPGETVKLDAVLTTYKGSLTYVATLRKIGDTKTFKVKGKWSGECFSSFTARTYNPVTGKLIGEYILK